MKKLLILLWLKQLFCKHRWLPKGNPSISQYAYYHQLRCPKCKKKKEVFNMFIILLFLMPGCAREYSCEGCYSGGDLITSYSIVITPTSVAKVIYPAVKTPANPGHYQFIDSIKITTLDTTYAGSYNLLDYFPAKRGDVFYVFYEIRGRAFTEQVQHDTLSY